MKTIRVISLILSLIMCVTVLSACSLFGGAKLPSDIDENGRFIFSIVRAEDSTQAVGDAAKAVRSAIKENIGASSSLIKDSVVEYSKGSYEILIGTCNRPESLEALKIVEQNRTNNAFDFIVKVIDNKICIQATTEKMLVFACEWFAKTFCQSIETWEQLRGNYEFLYAPDVDSVENKISGVDIGRFSVVKPLRCSFLPINEMGKVINYYNNYGLTMELYDDIDPVVENEILVGDTSREESKSVKVEGDNYIIKVIGSKLVIKGGNELSTWSGVNHFYKLVKESTKENPINWTDGYVINGKYDETNEESFTLNFGDEFEGSTVDLNVWGDNNYAADRPGESVLGGKIYGYDPAGRTTYKGALPGKMIYQSDGTITMAAAKLDGKDFCGTDMATFSSMLYKYGLIEINAQMAPAPASVSIWLNGTGEQNLKGRYTDITRSCFTEIDILENYGSEVWYGSAIHRWWTNYSADMQSTSSGHESTMSSDPKYHNETNNANYTLDVERFGGTLAETFNTYSMYWDKDGIKFAFNGRQYLEYKFADQQSVSVHCLMDFLIFSNWMGRAGYGATFVPGEHPEYCEFKMDYVRIYQSEALGCQMVRGDGQYNYAGDDRNTVILYPDRPIKNSY